MLVITGTQRSGTSAVAKMFIEAGYMEETFWDEEALGGYESREVAGFYREYLGDMTFPFEDFPFLPNFVFKYEPDTLSDIKDSVIKFSYLLMNPAFVYIWHKFRPAKIYHDKFLIMDRVPEAVVESKARVPQRFQHDSILLKQTSEGLRNNFFLSARTLKLLGYQSKVFRFEDLFIPKGYEEFAKTLNVLAPEFFILEETFKSVLKPNWRHF